MCLYLNKSNDNTGKNCQNVFRTRLFNQKLAAILSQSIQEKQVNLGKKLSSVSFLFVLVPSSGSVTVLKTSSLENMLAVKTSNLAAPPDGFPPKT